MHSAFLPLAVAALFASASLAPAQTPAPTPQASPAATPVKRPRKPKAVAPTPTPSTSPAAPVASRVPSRPTSATKPAQETPEQRTAAGVKANTPSATLAPGGGPGLVWVNPKSKVYHVQASRWYGRTKKGQYMTEADAKAAGNHPAPGKE